MFARGEMRHLVCHVLLTNGRALELQADAETTHGGVQVRPVRTRDVIDWARRLRGEKRKRRPPPSSPPKPDDPGGKP